MTTPGRPAKASSRGLRRSSGPAGARQETAAAARRQGGVPLGQLFGDGQHVAVSLRVEGDDAPLLKVTQDAGASDLKDVGHIGVPEARQGAALGCAVRTARVGNVHAIEGNGMQVRIEFQVG